MMRKIAIALAIATFSVVAYQSPGKAALFNFFQDGFDEGATLTGSFDGTDNNMDNIINTDNGDTVTDFMANFSGNSIIGATSWNFANLNLLFVVELNNNAGAQREISANNGTFTLDIFFPGGGGGGTSIFNNMTETGTNSSNAVQVEPVPEPEEIGGTILAIGLVGWWWYLKKRMGKNTASVIGD